MEKASNDVFSNTHPKGIKHGMGNGFVAASFVN
jgi:hypothetical protein